MKALLAEPKLLIIGVVVLLLVGLGIFALVQKGKDTKTVEEKYFAEEVQEKTDVSEMTQEDKDLLAAYQLTALENVSEEALQEVLSCIKSNLDEDKVSKIITTGKVKFLDYEATRECLSDWK